MSKLRELFTAMMPQSATLKTPYGEFNLAKKSDTKRLQSIVVNLQRQTDALTRKDLADWRAAWQTAINFDSPMRSRLYDIYRDVDIDLHLSGCKEQRVGYVMSRSFKIVKADGSEDLGLTKLFNQEWFKSLMRHCLDSIYWGHSLIELGDVIDGTDGIRRYSGVTLLPRKHVVPEKGRILIDPGQDWTVGIDYHSEPYSSALIEAGTPDGLGLYLKAATQTIPKKNALGFWDTFAEIFGMPMRIAKTTSRDPADRAKLENVMEKMGAALWGLFPEGTDIQVVESTKGDAFNVYDRRIDRANSELSKLIIGQTMTIEDGSSLSQSETHLKVFNNLVESDCDMLRDIVNGQLIPRMIAHGFPVEGCSFDWDYSEDYTPEQQVAYETMISDRYEVDPKYFEEKYGMPVGKRREGTPLMQKAAHCQEPFFD